LPRLHAVVDMPVRIIFPRDSTEQLDNAAGIV